MAPYKAMLWDVVIFYLAIISLELSLGYTLNPEFLQVTLGT